MTGILPIKKDGSQSAISEFDEFSMLAPEEFEPYFGFNESEVQALCKQSGADFPMIKRWYDGYSFDTGKSIYNPNSVMQAIRTKKIRSFWQQSAAADSLLTYINMDYDGLGKAAVELIAGNRIPINVKKFQNDLISFKSKDDVLTLLIHFGYLSYNADTKTAHIPNEEIRIEFAELTHDISHADTITRVKNSIQLINDTIHMDEKEVAAQIEKIHEEETSPLFYNGEQALRAVIKLAYFAYRDYYLQLEELGSGKGYADIVYLPKNHAELPALVIELKYEEAAESTIEQIKCKNYPEAIKNYGGDLLLVGISYKKHGKTKKHFCCIEKYTANN